MKTTIIVLLVMLALLSVLVAYCCCAIGGREDELCGMTEEEYITQFKERMAGENAIPSCTHNKKEVI